MSIDIAAENAKTSGRLPRGDLLVFGHGDETVAGFSRSISYNLGETVEFCVDGGAVTIDIYRCGWYGGDGFRLWGTVTNTPTNQPEATIIPDTNGATSCTGWSITATWDIPENAVSGIYLAVIRSVPPQAPNGFWVTFVVRDDAAQADLIYKTSDSTWGAAYNHYGTKSSINGSNIYGSGTGVGNIMNRSLAVSYHRPVITRSSVVQTMWHACELPMIRFLERNGYNMKYISCVDLDKGVDLGNSIFFSSGHDEYWSQPMRDHAVAHRDAGHYQVHSSANEVFWRTRYVSNGDEYIMHCWKDTMPGPSGYTRNAGAPFDPVSWTGTWKDTRWAGRQPENLLTGTDFRMNGVVDFNAVVGAESAAIPAWRDTPVAEGQTVTLVGVIGFEADSMMPAEPDAVTLAATPVNIDGRYADNNGQNYSGNGTLDWGIVLQRYTSGGATVGFGTCQWGWALDATHDRGGGAVQIAAQQFTVNLLADLGAPAQSLISGLVQPTPVSLSAYGKPLPGSVRRGDGTVLTPWLKTDDGLLRGVLST